MHVTAELLNQRLGTKLREADWERLAAKFDTKDKKYHFVPDETGRIVLREIPPRANPESDGSTPRPSR
jgi:hypothetical protein